MTIRVSENTTSNLKIEFFEVKSLIYALTLQADGLYGEIEHYKDRIEKVLNGTYSNISNDLMEIIKTKISKLEEKRKEILLEIEELKLINEYE